MAKLKYFLIAILASALAICCHFPATAQPPAQLTQTGHQFLEEGRPQEAFKTWEKALEQYEQANNEEAVLGTKINQSLALSAMGQNPRACNTLSTALTLEEWICDPQEPANDERLNDALNTIPSEPVTILAMHSLGNTLQGLGKSEEAILVLKDSLQKASAISVDPASIQLSLANTYTSLYKQKLNQSQLSKEYRSETDPDQSLKASSQAALSLYQQLSNQSDPNIALKAQLNQLELSQAFDLSIPQLKALDEQSKTQIPSMIERINQADFSLLTPIDSIYARLKFANSLIVSQQDLERVENHIQAATQTAQKLKNKRAIAASAFYSGKLHQQTGQTIQTQQDLEKGASLATSIQAWDLAYQSHAELAKLLQKNGNLTQAKQSYQAAIASLEQVRSNLLTVDHPFSYREEIEPIHRKYMQLLLSAPKPDLKAVIQANEQLQATQIENYLKCGKLDIVSLEQLRQEDQTPPVIHILQLADQIEILVSTDTGIHRHSAPAAPILEQLGFLTINIQTDFDRTGPVILNYAAALYDELIVPIKPYLPDDGTLLFVLDGDFQAIPMSILWDGERFLVEQYSIANALGSKVARPQRLPKDQLDVLFAGLSEISPSQKNSSEFTPQQALPFVDDEAEKINQYSDSDEILNTAFTTQRLQEKLSRTDTPILHISTHGQFSSSIDKTLIWAWDKAINLREMETMLRRKSDTQPLNLLILSACHSADGDRRATLGMAGIAAQAGAKSTLAPLWLVDDASTAIFMESFYQNLQLGETKAEALRTAQLSLVNSDNYRHPFFWASFLLIGSWI